MTSDLFKGSDSPFLDDFLIKEGSLGAYEDRINYESPRKWWDWPRANPDFHFTVDMQNWRVHYHRRFPLAFYHEKEFVFGFRLTDCRIFVDFESPDQVWARLVSENNTYRVVVEREDYPRFQGKGDIKLSHTPTKTQFPNVWRLGNGYSISCTRDLLITEYGLRVDQDAWFMLGPTSEENELSRRVLTVKIYDGPYPYQSRGTDIKLSDPAPLSSQSEYVIYAYDANGIKGTYKEVYQGVEPEKKANVLRGDSLFSYESKEGIIRERNGQLVGPGKVIYKLPLSATKLLDVYYRGSEVDLMMRADGEIWTEWENYDGRAVNTLEIEATVHNSLSSIRIEWESIKGWQPVGRPYIDVLKGKTEGKDDNIVKITGDGKKGEGLGQVVTLYTGSYTASANVRCLEGVADVLVGEDIIVSWNPLDKSIRAGGEFVVNEGSYELVLSGTGDFSYEVDRIRVAESGQKKWLNEDIKWWIENENGKVDAAPSINNVSTPVSLGESKKWRLGIETPKEIDERDVDISHIGIDLYRTGSDNLIKHLKWRGIGSTRIHYPENLTQLPVSAQWITTRDNGAVSWQQTSDHSEGDVGITIEGSPLSYKDEYIYRPVTLKNRYWRVEIGEEKATIYYGGTEVGVMSGQGLPFRISEFNSENIELDCSIGFVQLRRDLGPRFEGWTTQKATVPISTSGSVTTVFGTSQEEADDNLPYFSVTVGR